MNKGLGPVVQSIQKNWISFNKIVRYVLDNLKIVGYGSKLELQAPVVRHI